MIDVMAYLTHPTLSGWVFDLVQEDKSALTFGRVDTTGVKTHVGSIKRESDKKGFTALNMCGEQAHPRTLDDLFWFMWAYEEHRNMDSAFVWMCGRD